MPYRLASPNTGILAPKAYAGDSIDIVGTCTGPFTVDGGQLAAVDAARAQRELLGWRARQAATAEMRFIIDGEARLTQLQAGEANIVEPSRRHPCRLAGRRQRRGPRAAAFPAPRRCS